MKRLLITSLSKIKPESVTEHEYTRERIQKIKRDAVSLAVIVPYMITKLAADGLTESIDRLEIVKRARLSRLESMN